MIIAAKIQVKELESKRGTTSLRRDHFFSEAACHRKLQLFGYHMTQNEVTADKTTSTGMEYTVNILPPSLQNYPHINMIVPLQSVPIPVQSGVQ